MTITELGAIGELVGGVAVVGSLLYVGLQIRNNTVATRAASHHAVTDSFNQFNLLLGRDPHVARVFRKGIEHRASLDPDELLQFDMLCLSVLRIHETLFYQSRVGAAERRLLVAEQRSLRATFALPGIRDWWKTNPYSFDTDFFAYAESFFPDSVETGDA